VAGVAEVDDPAGALATEPDGGSSTRRSSTEPGTAPLGADETAVAGADDDNVSAAGDDDHEKEAAKYIEKRGYVRRA